MRASLALAGDLLAAAADRRMGEAMARSAAADDLLVRLDAPGPVATAPDLATVEVEPRPGVGLPRALGAWLLSWPLDGLSRLKLGIARSELRARASAPDRPAVRARDGP